MGELNPHRMWLGTFVKRTGAIVSAEVRAEVLARDNYECRNCGRRAGLELHHIKERRKGRDDRPINLVTLCHNCHYRITVGYWYIAAWDPARNYLRIEEKQ
jgi:5-methylcytosine-specific restriction endonuclease McrA